MMWHSKISFCMHVLNKILQVIDILANKRISKAIMLTFKDCNLILLG
jgi:hypothetical protein